MADNLTKETVLLGIDEAVIFPLTTDDSTTTTYGAGIKVPGIKELTLSPVFLEKELKGDETVLDVYAKLEQIEWTIEHGIVSLDALAILIGGKVTADAGGTTQTYSLTGKDLPDFFKLEARVIYSDVGDVHFVLHKCKCTSLTYTLTGEEYATFSAGGKAIPTINDKAIKDIVFNKTAATILTTGA